MLDEKLAPQRYGKGTPARLSAACGGEFRKHLGVPNGARVIGHTGSPSLSLAARNTSRTGFRVAMRPCSPWPG
jgi:hypothetical protein